MAYYTYCLTLDGSFLKPPSSIPVYAPLPQTSVVDKPPPSTVYKQQHDDTCSYKYYLGI